MCRRHTFTCGVSTEEHAGGLYLVDFDSTVDVLHVIDVFISATSDDVVRASKLDAHFPDLFISGASATPGAPYGITMLSCDGSSITLAWRSPKHCGGSKINAYYIDKRDVDSLVWKEVNQEAVTEKICTVGTRPSDHKNQTII